MGKPKKNGEYWRIRWTDHSGERQSKNFLNYKDAEFELQRLELEVANIKRGLSAPLVADKSVAHLCDYWIENCIPLKRDGKSQKSIIERHIRPELGEISLRELTVAQIDKFQVSRLHLDKKTVSNILTLLISMLHRAVEMRWLERCPKIKKPKTSIFSSDYRFLRTQNEIDRFLIAAHEQSELTYVLYATAVYTGMREGELAALKKSSVDFQKRIVTVLGSFNGQTKSGDIRYIPMLDPLMPILQKWFLQNPGQLVFPNQVGKMRQPSDRIFQEILHKVLTAANFPKLHHKGKERWYIRFHDLRHTFASHWVMAGGDIFKLQKILGHKSIQMTQRYSHLAPHAFAGDYGRLGVSAPAPQSAKVISINQNERTENG